eukprot:TRINITY_DN4004_c0_g1_i3.p1 TRINITY_DN4004_c0_g1~~TRINITY_DN4004_c0_g1_i3.p1  ORF type:complete len:189 (-),score=18.22 TRINITY_DN4004_c0_g1_i3:300-866(-)
MQTAVQRTLATSYTAQKGLFIKLFSSLTDMSNFYDFTVKDIEGKDVSMKEFAGKVLLIVNVASQCGFTPQYQGLQSLQDKYQNRDFTVLGFPCNQFGAQEPGSNAEIKEFACSRFKATFPLMGKVDVNGSDAHPLWSYMKKQKGGFGILEAIKWNFTKFLIDKEGNVVGRFSPMTKPEDLEKEIEKLL